MPERFNFDNALAWLDSIVPVTPSDNQESAPDPLQLGAPSTNPSPAPFTSVSPNDAEGSSPPISSPNDARRPSATSKKVSTAAASSSDAAPPAKPPRRRIRPKIALDPNQPLTARGKPRARVYVACNQCRVRKTRCDGAKPVCFNCRKRPPEDGEECSYEEQPKRRGQDKVPGLRVRCSSHGPRKRKRTGSDDSEEEEGESSPEEDYGPRLHASYRNFPGVSAVSSDESDYDPFPLVDLDHPAVDMEFTVPVRPDSPVMPTRPSLQFTRDTWWDALLTFYSTEEGLNSSEALTLSTDQRTATVLSIVTDLRALFSSSLWWTSFIHLPRFWDTLLTPPRRKLMQPSLVLSALAIGVFAQSSEAERGTAGRLKAMKLIDMAHSSMQASLATGWVDFGLVQAAWLIVYFELQSHPRQSLERNRSSLLLLDSLIRLFSLTSLDADIPNAHYTRRIPIASDPAFVMPPRTIGSCTLPELAGSFLPRRATPGEFETNTSMGSISGTPTCNCLTLTIAHSWPSICGIAPAWAPTPMWPDSVSEAEFKKEECRRLVWASLMVTASMDSYQSVLENAQKTQLWIKNPDNYAVLFPGESLALAGVPAPASNVWAIYLRTMLLLHKCVQTRNDPDATQAEFALYAWVEIDAIERALDAHTCMLERRMGFQAREMLFAARMCISHEFQRYIPQVCTQSNRLFYRDRAEQWLRQRMAMSEHIWRNLLAGMKTPSLDYRRPVLIYWHMSHIMKALVMWKSDNTLLVALEAGKVFAKRTEYMMMYWPSTPQRQAWEKVRFDLVDACRKAGVPPPDPNIPASFAQLRARFAAQSEAQKDLPPELPHMQNTA